MTARKKAEPRAFTVADIEQRFELASYWWGEKWCPAVHRIQRSIRNTPGFGIRVLKSKTMTAAGEHLVFDFFEVADDGTITTAPRGYAREYKPGRVTDIAEAVGRYAIPQDDALRINLGGAL